MSQGNKDNANTDSKITGVATETETTNSQAASTWQANPQLLAAISELGFTPLSAEKALFYTDNNSLDAAVAWLLDNPQAQTDATPLSVEVAALGELVGSVSGSGSGSSEESLQRQEGDMFKMVLVVNSSLKMGVGKVAAQVGHASLGLYRSLAQRSACVESLATWRETGEATVVLRSDGGEDHLAQLKRQAEATTSGVLGAYLVRDAGRTQIAAGSATVLALFATEAKLQALTGQLKLL